METSRVWSPARAGAVAVTSHKELSHKLPRDKNELTLTGS